jgi:hypothetical protein
MPKPQGYVEVHERIRAFYDKHPEGSLQGHWHVAEVGGDTLIVYRAEAFRTPQDERPGIGFATEPYPGKTSFTRDSELMNAETSAWGRAIAALGFEVHRGIASASEVRNRGGDTSPNGEASPAQKRAVTTILNKAGVAKDFQRQIVHAIAGNPVSKAGASEILDLIAGKDDAELDHAITALIERSGVIPPSDVPVDDEGLPPVPEGSPTYD